MERMHEQPESLAAFLARLRPGDRCVCCGIVLQPLDRPRLGRTAHRAAHVERGEAVLCRACGCELSEEAAGEADEGSRELSPAA